MTKKDVLRKKAEALAHEKAARMPENPGALSPEETQRMLHELQMHQIELEMQNEELRQTQLDLDAARARYFDLYDLAPVGYCTLSEQGLILEANLTAATLLGVARGALVKTQFSHFILSEDQRIYHHHCAQLFKTGATQSCEVRLLQNNGDIFWAQLVGTVAQDSDGATVLRITLNDVSERKRAEEMLRAILESPQGMVIFALDVHFCYTAFTVAHKNTMKAIWGVEIEIGMNMLDVISNPLDREKARGNFERAMRGEHFILIEEYGNPANYRTFYENRYSPIHDDTGLLSGVTVFVTDITERKLAEDALRESQELFLLFMRHSPIYVFIKEVTATESRVLQASENYQDMTGIAGSGMVGKNMYELFPPEFAEKITTDDRAVISSGEVLKLDETLNGRHYTTIKFPLIQGGKTLLAGYTIDITERVQAEAALRGSEEKFRAIIEQSADGIILIDERGDIIEWNHAQEQMTGILRSEALGQPAWDVQFRQLSTARRAQVSAKRFKQIMLNMLETGQSTQFNRSIEVQIQPVSGEPRTILQNAFPVKQDKGYRLGIIIHDITDRKRTEDALRWNQTLLQLMSNASPLGFLVVDSRTDDILYFNQRFCEIWGIQHLSDQMQRGELKNNDIIPACVLVLMDASAFAESCKQLQDESNRVVLEDEIAFTHGRTIRRFTTQIRGEKDEYYGRFYIFEDVTERKLVDEALQDSEEKYRGIIEQSRDGIFISDEHGNVAVWNQSMESITGIQKRDALGKSLYEIQLLLMPEELSTPELLEQLKANLKNIIGLKMEWSGATRDQEIKCADGTRKIVQDTSFVIKTNNAAKIGVIFHDLTERKQAEEELDESKRLFHLLIESLSQNIYAKGMDGRFIFANQRYCATEGKSLEEIIGKTDFELHPLELAEKYLIDDRLVLETGKTIELVEEHQPIGKDRFFVQVIKTPFSYSKGQPAGILGIFWDITERKQAEEALKLRESYLTAIIENQPGLVSLKDIHGRFLAVNGAFVQACRKKTPDEIVGKTDLDIWPRGLAEKYRADDIEVIQHKKPLHVEESIRDMGETKWFETFKTPVFNEAGQVIGTTSFARDITERKLVQIELQYMKNGLEDANAELQIALAREQQLARIDALTGVNNRGFLNQLARHEFDVAIRYQKPLSMMMFDIDDFKHINDNFGHSMGDEALKKITQIVCAKLRSSDVIGRYGGDEFNILLPHTSAEEALILAERIHAGIASLCLDTDKGPLTLTISLGIAQTIHSASQPDTVEKLFVRADRALYAAKKSGKNRSVVFDGGD